MIIGFDHVALNIADPEAAGKRLSAEGYEEKFAVPHLPNSDAKTPLLGTYRSDHAIAYYASPSLLPIELTHHGTEQGRKTETIEYCGDHLTLKVPNAVKEADFWRSALGFSDGGNGRLVFNAMLAQWRCAISLEERADAAPSLLDDEGYTCIALLVKNMDHDMQRMEKAGARETTAIFSQEMNGRPQRIAMFRTPGGIIVELVEINKR